MCCSAVTLKRDFDVCSVCVGGGMHAVTERRITCTSKTCSDIGVCAVVWKVFTCTASDTWTIWVNEHGHMRGVLECEGPHKAVITAQMKKFILQQDECAVPPQLILSSMRRSSDILEPKRGYPTLSQVTNCAKYLRRL
ncbi:hypothetical protein PHYSODRAFT_500241 [Phytophthora sojae]|uniref:Uncharacterized protein n=1 Tax=Phytophthora sojae (strain P6497) TaxID=1094619 RepID=G4ZG49_PHYSP|nr:hypothetical protein PHYSODRAFT_500241 [Phytophthora sojae]EGZ17533.1 hypothetical protein PHYSODRAFT_500241 [Phytophthora sojae]|eukprot:XP_009526591.1 hypothetical protein PHYSODRAFT_500241 [Phytophthora sojae]